MPDMLSVIRNIIAEGEESGFVAHYKLLEMCAQSGIDRATLQLIIDSLEEKGIRIVKSVEEKSNALILAKNDLSKEGQIFNIIQADGKVKAKNIAKQLNVNKKEVNKYLYRHLDKFQIDEFYFWSLIG